MANDRRFELPDEVKVLITAKNAATRKYDSFPSRENRRSLNHYQQKIKESA